MKKMKKLAALLLALVLVTAMVAMPASAAETDGAINITGGTVIEDEYSIYKIFDYDDGKSTSSAFFYTVDTDWSGLSSHAGVGEYYTVDGSGYVTWQKDDTPAAGAAFAALVLDYLKTVSITADKTQSVATTGAAVSFSGLSYGYYLIVAKGADGKYRTPGVASVTSGEAVKITAKDVVVGLPDISKEVLENSTWGEFNDAAFGNTVNFKITITAEAAGKGYVLTDVLPNGMKLTTTSIKVNNTDISDEVGTLTTTSNGFAITFKQSYLDELKTGDTIQVTYDAIVNNDGSNVIIGGTGNVNTSTLTYKDSADANVEKSDSTRTYVYKVIVNKQDDEGNALTGAGFTLYKNNGGTYTKLTEIAAETESTFGFSGLDAGEYMLVESTVPSGYSKVDDITFTISATLSKSGADIAEVAGATVNDTEGSVTFTVENVPGTQLPTTGGIGTTIFYVVGGVLVLAALVVLITKKRMAA